MQRPAFPAHHRLKGFSSFARRKSTQRLFSKGCLRFTSLLAATHGAQAGATSACPTGTQECLSLWELKGWWSLRLSTCCVMTKFLRFLLVCMTREVCFRAHATGRTAAGAFRGHAPRQPIDLHKATAPGAPCAVGSTCPRSSVTPHSAVTNTPTKSTLCSRAGWGCGQTEL